MQMVKPAPRLTQLELRIMDMFWDRGALAIREVQEGFPAAARPAYTTIQTTVYRLESKGALVRTKKIGNAHIFEAAMTRKRARRRLADDFIALFGGLQPAMAHLVESGKLTLEDVQETERLLLKRLGKDKADR